MRVGNWFVALVILSAGCGPSKLKQADAAADKGDWESAYAQYRMAALQHPGDKGVADRLKRAQAELSREELGRAELSNANGHMAEAGEHWRRAMDLALDPTVKERARQEITDNASALEYYGDVSTSYAAWADAISAYGALLEVRSDDVDLLERYRTSKREYAGELTAAADELARRNLAGAALLADLKALQHDPMQPGAFDRVTNLRKELAGRTKVALNQVTVEDRGFHAFGLTLVPKLSSRLDAYPPYGPTKDPEAVPGTFTAVVETYEKSESTAKGQDILPNSVPASKDPIANPAVEEQQKKIDGLEKELAELKGELKQSIPPRSGKPAPTSKKRVLPPDAEAKRQQGLNLARSIDGKRKEVAAAKLALKALPATVMPPPPAPTWVLSWADVTRTVEARVRFELWEKDSDQPLTLTLTKKVSHTDRTHAGNEKQGVLPDPLELPSYDTMNQELAAEFMDGAQLIGQARDRRTERLLALARSKKQMGNEEEALNAYVESLFLLGPERAPEDAKVALAREADVDQLRDILGAH